MRRIDWLAVTLLLLFAAGLRIIGISYGQPNLDYFPSTASFGMVHEQIPIQPDEFFNVSIPVNMALRNRLNPEFFNYPSFIINTNFVLFHLTGALEGLSLADREGFNLRAYAGFPLYVMSRMYSVYGGLLMVACAYAISRMVAGRYVALCAGLLVAVTYTLVQHSHYIKPGTLAGGWMMLAAWACIASLYSRRPRYRERLYIFAGVVTGLAATTRYNAAAVGLIVLLAGLILLYRYRTRRMLRMIGLAWLAVPLIFILGSPYILRDFDHFWHDFLWIVGQYTTTGADVPEHFITDAWSGLAYMLIYTALFATGIPALISMGLSFLAGWQRRPQGHFFRHNSPLLYVSLIGLLILAYTLAAVRTIRPAHSEHMLILILPFVALLSALGAGWLVDSISLPKRFLMPAVILILVIQPLLLSLQVVKMFTQTDTRYVMLEWIHDNIPRGARIFLNGSYNVPLDEARYPNEQQFVFYAETLPDGKDYDYMIYSDALAYDILKSEMIVPPDVLQQQRDYLAQLDANFKRVAEIRRPVWAEPEVMINTAAYWHNPSLIVYCLNPRSCEKIK